MTVIAKVTSKGQVTIPQEIRTALGVQPGDLLAWEMAADGRIEVHRVQPLDVEYLRALDSTLSEWTGAADDEAYRDL